MGKKDKKKGKGAEKTASKTEKKAAQKLRKELSTKGEADIEQLIAEFQEKEKQLQQVVEEKCGPPSFRSSLTLCAHPDKEELLFFGGEYFNGNKTFMYNDFYVYNIKKNQWSVIKCPNSPPPRCSHQAVTVSHSGGQMWIFGGEFASPTRSQFYHYRDLWVYHLTHQRWEQITVPGGPSARSGHRMVVCKKKIIVFGGFHESIRDFKYYNDVHAFDLENYQWTKLAPVGNGPTSRSGCQMATTIDGKVIIYGGYSRQKVKKDIDHGVIHTDMFILQCEEKDDKIIKWKWTQIKQSGIKPSPRCGFTFATAPGNRAYAFGGVHDNEEEDEMLVGNFYNDLYMLELDKGRWLQLELNAKKECLEKKRRRRQKDNITDSGDEEEEDNNALEIDRLHLSEKEKPVEQQSTSEDGVFTVTIGKASSSSVNEMQGEHSKDKDSDIFCPLPRMNTCLAITHGILYLYGGMYENGDKRVTLSDFYTLDLHKLNEWHIIIPPEEKQEWIESDTEGSSDDGEDMGACGDDDKDAIETGDSEDSDMEVT